MGEPGRCDIARVTVESVARPVDQASAGFLDWVGLRTNADPAGSALLSTAKSEICFEGFERRPAFDARRRDGQFSPIERPRGAPKESWQRKAVSRRPRNRPRHSARELFNNVPRGDRSGGLQGFLYRGRFNMPHVWQDNRLLGLDPFDWFVLLGGSVLSGAMVWLS
jgi:hypothetical protein